MKKKLIIFVSVLLVFLVIGVGIYYFSQIKKEEEKIVISDERVKELYENSYKIFYLMNADVKTTDGFIGENDKKYYYLQDELLEDLKSFNDIVDLIKDTFVPYEASSLLDALNEENYNRFISTDLGLYVLKRKKVCQNLPSASASGRVYDFVEDKKVIIYPEDIAIYAYKEDDDIWRLGLQANHCQDIDE